MVAMTAVLELLSLSSVFPRYAPKTYFLNFTAGERGQAVSGKQASHSARVMFSIGFK